MLEQAARKFHLEHAAHRAVEYRLRDKPALHGLLQMRETVVPQAHIDAGGKRIRAVGRGVAVCQHAEPVDRAAVRHDDAVKAHLAAQHILQKPCVCVARHAVDLVVRRHHALCAGPCRGGHRRQVNLPKLAPPVVSPCAQKCFESASTPPETQPLTAASAFFAQRYGSSP